MNPIFKFHFDYMFRKTLPGRGELRGAVLYMLAMLPVTFVITTQERSLAWLNHSLIAKFMFTWFLAGVVFPLVWAGAFGLANGLIWLYRFRGYDTIDLAPGYRAFRMTPDQRAFAQFDTDHITKDRERIIGSANIDDEGNIYTVREPGRHHHVLWYMKAFGKNNKCRQQGFLTNRYRFLGRQDARKLAIANGQAPSPDHNRDLFSEDLWDTPEHLQFKG